MRIFITFVLLLFVNKSFCNNDEEIEKLFNKAEDFYSENEYDSSIATYEQILSITANDSLVAIVNSQLGVVYSEIYLMGISTDYYLKAIDVLEDGQPSSNLIETYVNLGHNYFAISDDSTAMHYFNLAEKVAIEIKDTIRLDYAQIAISQYYLEQKNYDLVIDLCQQIKINAELTGDSINSVSARIIIAEAYKFTSQTEKAQSELNDAIVLAKKYKRNQSLSTILIQLAFTSFYGKDDNLNAEKYAKESLELAKKIDNWYVIKHCYYLLSEIEKQKNNYENALEFYINYSNYTDSIVNKETKNDILKQSIEFEYQKQKEIDDLKHQQELALEEEKNKKQKIALFSFGGGLLLVGGLLAFIYSRLQIIQKQKVALDSAYDQLEESKKNELAVSNLKALQSQMNPHFIFNALNSVQDLVLLKDIKNSNKYLGKFSDLVRKILLSSKQQFIPLDEEIEILELYLDLEKLRFGDEFKIDFECSLSENEQTEIDIPAMFIQPYIENAIKHGLFHKKGEKQLKVHFFKNNDYLRCEIEDNGVGQEKANQLKQSRLHLHTGFSTEAIENRIRLLNQTLDQKIKVEIIDLLDENKQAIGTKVLLDFPFN